MSGAAARTGNLRKKEDCKEYRNKIGMVHLKNRKP